MSSFQNIKLILSVSFGWFVLGHLWNRQMNSIFDAGVLSQRSLQHCECPSIRCLPCAKDNQTENAEKRKLVAKSYFRSYRYKPISSAEDETNRWRLLTRKYHYEMINQEPRVGINGMWKAEVDSVDRHAQSTIKIHDSKNEKLTGPLEMEEIYRHLDPFHGLKYLVNYMEKEKSEFNRHTSVELWRPFVGGKPKLISIEHASGKEMINIISPLSKVTERFNLFLQRYEDNVLLNHNAGPVRLIFVIFKSEDSDDNTGQIVSVLDKFKARNPNALVHYLFTNGEFNRAVGLHTGVMQCKDDEIVLFLDVDLRIGADFLGRVRRNAVKNKRVIFPIMYSQYDPDILAQAAKVNPELKPLVEDNMQINKQTGFWIYYAYGVAAMYKADYLKVGGFRLDIRGWGGEDVDLFKKMVADPDLDVMSMVDPDLIHIYHKRGCDATLADDQYAMCIGAWSETLGSQLEVATLYLDSHVTS